MTLVHDLRHAWRLLRRDRAASAVIIVTLALGIAATSIMFGVVDQMLLRAPAGIAEAGSVRRLYFGTESGPRRAPNQSYAVLKTIAEGVSAFSGTAAIHRASVTLGAGEGARSSSAPAVQ